MIAFVLEDDGTESGNVLRGVSRCFVPVGWKRVSDFHFRISKDFSSTIRNTKAAFSADDFLPSQGCNPDVWIYDEGFSLFVKSLNCHDSS